MAKSILFIGGTGIISSACVNEAVAKGHAVTVLNRSKTTLREISNEVEFIRADVRDIDEYRKAVAGRDFDCVADFIAFIPDHVKKDAEVFKDNCGQYIFISSASAYQKPVLRLPITESTPLINPYWQYSRDKIACEDFLLHEHRMNGFPMTIVRPSHTYDETLLPFEGGYSVISRMKAGLPVVIHGDGTSLWTLTYNKDFAAAFVRLIANDAAIGDSFHITSDELLTWNQIYQITADAAGIKDVTYLYLSSSEIAEVVPEIGPSLLGDKSYSVMFDNSKIKSVAPGWQAKTTFREGAEKIISFYDSHPELCQENPQTAEALDLMAARALSRQDR